MTCEPRTALKGPHHSVPAGRDGSPWLSALGRRWASRFTRKGLRHVSLQRLRRWRTALPFTRHRPNERADAKLKASTPSGWVTLPGLTRLLARGTTRALAGLMVAWLLNGAWLPATLAAAPAGPVVTHVIHVTHAAAPVQPASRQGTGGLLSIDPGMALFTLVIFLVLLAVLGRYAWTPLITGLKRREDAIRENIEAAAAAQAKVEQTRRQLEEKIAQVQHAAALQLQQAKADAARAADAIRQRAEAETKALKDQALRDIQMAQQQAMRELAVKAADLSVDIAERLLQRHLNDVDREKLLEESVSTGLLSP